MSSNSGTPPDEWYFITPPQDVAFTKEGQYSQIDTYGTNQPYLQYGMTGLRQLNLGNAMIEGFSNGKKVEQNIRSLEHCMLMQINGGAGYTSPYCWKAYAGGKCYGTFIITNVSIRETMRDVDGGATRAFADITLHEVSDYQVESGIDLASRATYSARPPAQEQEQVSQEEVIKQYNAQIAERILRDILNKNPGMDINEARQKALVQAAKEAKQQGLAGNRIGDGTGKPIDYSK